MGPLLPTQETALYAVPDDPKRELAPPSPRRYAWPQMRQFQLRLQTRCSSRSAGRTSTARLRMNRITLRRAGGAATGVCDESDKWNDLSERLATFREPAPQAFSEVRASATAALQGPEDPGRRLLRPLCGSDGQRVLTGTTSAQTSWLLYSSAASRPGTDGRCAACENLGIHGWP